MAISNITETLPYDVHEVWGTITSVDDYTWRSDVSRTEVLNDKQFIEYTKDDFATTFTITAVEPLKRWEFDLENSNMEGHWTGKFTQVENNTKIDFTEDVTAKKFYMKPFVKIFLKKQQAQFVDDLKKVLSTKINQA